MKLKERSAELSSSCSPVPSPDYDAPSPAGSGGTNIFKMLPLLFLPDMMRKGRQYIFSGDEMEIRLPDEQAGEVIFIPLKYS